MIRPIEFRAWIPDIKRIYHVMSLDVEPQNGRRKTITVWEHPSLKSAIIKNKVAKFRLDDDVILMQFTGLLDKNGVKIFEGDILDIHQSVNGCSIFVVEWFGLGWTVRYGANMTTPRLYEYDINSFFKPCDFSGEVDYEIIGNIHQNPELLTRGNKK